MEAALNGAVSASNSDVYAVSVSRDAADQPVVAFDVAVASTVTAADIVSMFDELVSRATTDTLVASRDVIASSIFFDESKAVSTTVPS